MDVSAVAQVTQNQSPVAAQEGDDSVSMLFSYLLKHQLGTGQTGGGLLDSNPMINMVGNGPAYVPQPPPAQPSAQTGNANSNQTQSNQNAGGNGVSNGSGSGQQTNTVDANAGNNSGSNAQTGTGNQDNQQTSSDTGSSNSGTQTTTGPTATTAAPAPASTGEDAVTEATAAAAAVAIHLVQQSRPVALADAGPAQPVANIVDPLAGPATAPTGPTQAQTAAAAAPVASGAHAAAADADEGDVPEASHWSLNFLATASAATPQIAQQASSLSQITNGTSATVSVQTTTSGSTVTSPSASALVPDAVLAVSGFLQDGGQNASTGGGTGGQSNDQQTAGSQTDPNATDPDAMMLAEDAQALFALSSAIQTVAQDLAANAAQPQTSVAAAPAAGAGAASSAMETPLPQISAPAAPSNNPTGFAAQLQENDQTQAPQAKTQVALPAAIDQIKMQIEKGLAQGSSTIKVQLTPENMGRVEIKLQVQDGSVKATITADRADTLAVLKFDQQGLVQSLQDAGLNADSNSLSFFLRGEQQQRQFAQARQGRGQSGGASGEDDPLLAGVAAASGATAGGAGNLDISV